MGMKALFNYVSSHYQIVLVNALPRLCQSGSCHRAVNLLFIFFKSLPHVLNPSYHVLCMVEVDSCPSGQHVYSYPCLDWALESDGHMARSHGRHE
ncbi:hypothetical protein BCR44DRAFT_1425471, partial [Catenaria anguillulae PL171]